MDKYAAFVTRLTDEGLKHEAGLIGDIVQAVDGREDSHSYYRYCVASARLSELKLEASKRKLEI